uniref:Ig-like domain-containing protein n=1 Tax=Xenopus tropicalis TaxID=8364 RepID=A0A803JZG1_XENTR
MSAAAKGNTEPIPKPEIRVSRDEITEGYNMSISCHTPTSAGESPGLQFALYRDGTILYQFSSASEWHISPAQTEQLAYYTCAVRPSKREGEQRSAAVYIHMQEVVSGLVLNVNQNTITEGDTLSLTCDIQGSRYGNNAQLKFNFYKRTNGLPQSSSTDQQFQLLPSSLSSEYRVPSVRVQHSGEYVCAAVRPDNTVIIWSSPITIQIPEMFSKPKLRVSPNPITEGSARTLTCGTTSSTVSTRELQFAFYWDGQELQGFSSSNQYQAYSVQLQKSGNYKCAVQHPAKKIKKESDMFNIRVVEMFSKPKLSVSPNPITEGSALTLTCGTTSSTVSTRELHFAFYWDGQELQGFSSSNQYRAYSVQLEDSGNYKCAVQHPLTGISKKSEVSYIRVEEMFSKPELRVSSNPITEGSALTLTCGTTSSTVSTRELQFAFYWYGQELQGFTSSNQYQVYSVQLEDSGNYTCEVQHPTKNIKKTSVLSCIQVTGGAVRPVVSLSPNWANILTGDKVTLTCDVGSTAGTAPRYSWYKDSEMMNKDTLTNKHTINYAWKTNSGTYQCQTDTSERSEPVSVSVTDGPLILQAPLYVYEGDSLTMRCYRMFGWDTMFYKDNNPVGPTYGDELHIEGVNMTVTGTYRCSKGKTYQSGEVFISVR